MTQFRTWTSADMKKQPSEALLIDQKKDLMKILNMTMEEVDAFVDAKEPDAEDS